MVEEIREQRWFLSGELQKLSFIEEIFPSETNFILMRVKNANELYEYLLKRQIVVRNRSNQPLCHNCLRVTVGTPEENELLLQALYEYTEQLY
jgi:histidinol-phosphate aminotransferase